MTSEHILQNFHPLLVYGNFSLAQHVVYLSENTISACKE